MDWIRDLPWKKGAYVFFAMLALDLAFTYYVIYSAAKAVWLASFWAGALQIANVFVVKSYVADVRMAVPCVIGAFVGTALAILFIL